MKTLTKAEFDKIPRGEIFAIGVLPNSSTGLFMSDGGGELRWVAKKGYGNDWAVYTHWSKHGVTWIAQHGDKVTMDSNIRKCVPCDDEVFRLYRY